MGKRAEPALLCNIEQTKNDTHIEFIARLSLQGRVGIIWSGDSMLKEAVPATHLCKLPVYAFENEIQSCHPQHIMVQ